MAQEVTAKLVQELRSRTGISIGKCKKALVEAEGDMDQAIDNLRKAGLASAVKKEGREAKEGMIVVGETGDRIAIVEVNTETDFVAKNEQFQQFASAVASTAASNSSADIESFLALPSPEDPSITIDQFRALTVQGLGENIQIRRLMTFNKAQNHSYGVYSHMGGKIVVAVILSGSADQGELARDLAMHTAAEAPEFIDAENVSEEVRQKEREIALEQVKDKPDHIKDKIVQGKLEAFYNQVCLLRQKFIKDTDVTVTELLAKTGKESGNTIQVERFIRWSVGEGS